MERTHTVNMAWALAYHTNSRSPRAKRWYHIARFVHADDGWFELYWYENANLRGDNQAHLRKQAHVMGLELLPGVFSDKPAPRRGGEMAYFNFVEDRP